MSCGVGRRRGSDLALLWLWRRLAAIALTGPLAWELPYAGGAALNKQAKKTKIPGKFQKAKVEFAVSATIFTHHLRCIYNYLPSIYIVLCTLSNLEMI